MKTKEKKQYPLVAYGTKHLISLERTSYLTGGLAVTMVDYAEGYEEPYATLTVNLESFPYPLDADTAFLNTNICCGVDILQWVVENNIAYPMGVTETSGFCEYPLVRFNMDCF